MNDPAIRIALVTLGVEDLARASAFYEAMGLKRSRASQATIHFYDMDGVVLALFPNDMLAEDAGVPGEGHGFRRATLAWNVADEAAVDAGFARVLAAGAVNLKPPYKTAWGGYVGHFADTEGHLWEIAHNPFFPLHANGAVSVPPLAKESKMTRQERIAKLKQTAKERVLILDGSWGVMFQKMGLQEHDYRGDRFATHAGQMKGNNDILCLTRPDLVAQLHEMYFDAGADISETNTFSATTIAQDDYKLDAKDVWDINYEGARIGREVADAFTAKQPDKPRFLAGSMGPLNKMLSMSSDVNDPGARLVDFDEVYRAYRDQVRALNEGGVDLYLIETITDTLNCKAAIKAIMDLEAEGLEKLPIWISGTITDRSGRTLSGQTTEAFWNSVKHAKPFAVGFNCALGADLMRPFIAEMARVADTLVAAYPNAGLPNEMGQYDEQPHETAHAVEAWAKEGLVNILGGCCGTTPDHIRHVAESVKDIVPRKPPERAKALRLAGLEPFELA